MHDVAIEELMVHPGMSSVTVKWKTRNSLHPTTAVTTVKMFSLQAIAAAAGSLGRGGTEVD